MHLLSPGEHREVPVLLFSGGIDTWKMDLHPLAVGLAGCGPYRPGVRHPRHRGDPCPAGRVRR